MNSSFNKKSLIFGSSVGDLTIKNLETGEVQIKSEHLMGKRTWIRSIKKDKYHRYWVGSTLQLAVYDKNFKLVKNFIVEEEVNFYGNFNTFYLDGKKQRGYWWVSRSKIDVIDLRTMRVIYSIFNLVKGI